MIKLIASDMDGTLINSSHEISSRNLNAIRRAQESGIEFAIATGRDYSMVKPFLDKYQLKCEAIVMNGAEYRDCKGEVIESIGIEKDKVKDIINLSPQETAVAPKLTVKENLMMIARLHGSSKQEAREKADKIMETFELTDRKNDRAKQLSGGWQRKLSIAMALISNPKILFLDEPTIGLDVRARRELWGTMEKLKGKLTLILTTHYLEEAEELADRICIMDKGVVQVLGTADEIIKVSGARNFEEAFLMYTERGTEL